MGKKIVLIVSVLLVFAIQIINIASGVHYDWVVIAIELLLILLVAVLVALISLKNYQKMVVHFNNKNYDYVLSCKHMFFTKKNKEKHYIYYMKAMAYLEKKDLENFIFYVDKIDHRALSLTKYFLKIIYSYLTNDEVQKRVYKEEYKNCYCEDQAVKSRYDTILRLVEKKEPYTEDEYSFVDSLSFEQIKALIKKQNN